MKLGFALLDSLEDQTSVLALDQNRCLVVFLGCLFEYQGHNVL